MIGTSFGHYRILGRLGAGGMGEVYRARDETLGRDVAIKVLPAGALGDGSARARLVREARSAAALNHPNVCTIHEVGDADGQVFIAMEVVEGAPLDTLIPPEGLPGERALALGLQVAEAVAHAHDRGIVHRDLKPSNVLVAARDRVKVLDFGLAKPMAGPEAGEASTASHATLTEAGAVVGTLPYMAPEQLRGEPADARSDVWALGVVLYEMSSGARPFRGRTGFEVSSAILTTPPAPMPARVSRALSAVVARCLDKDPSRRYQRGSEVEAALEAVRMGAASPAAIPRAAGSPIQALAVLPLENLSGDPAQDFFADGMTETLITDLARLKGLTRVIARGSVLRFRKTNRPISEVARELGVDGLVTGAVLRSGDRVRVTAQLVDGASDAQIWAASYERELRDVLALQSELTRAIAGELRVQLGPAERPAPERRVDPEAYENYLRGRFFYSKNTVESTETALEYYRKALEKDPDNALAHSGIALVWLGRGHLGIVSPREALARAREPIAKAIALDGASAEAHTVLGGLRFYLEWDWAGAEREILRAIELNPNNPDAHQVYADLLLVRARPEQALEEVRRALELDPLNFWMQMAVGGRLLRLGRWDEGVAALRRSMSNEPNLTLARRYLWIALHHEGRGADASAEAGSYFALLGWPDVAEAVGRGFAHDGYSGAMREAARALEARAKRSYVQGTQVAALYAYAGDPEKALEWLERAYDAGDSWLVFLMDDPRFESLRSAPRFQAVLRRMNLPDKNVPDKG
jgi:TolB-like protein/Flp pilus assembly protein TadD